MNPYTESIIFNSFKFHVGASMSLSSWMKDKLSFKSVSLPSAPNPAVTTHKTGNRDEMADSPMPRTALGAFIDYLGPDARRIVPFPMRYRDMYIVRDACAEYKTAVNRISGRVLMNGSEWKPRFTAYCPTCVKEHKDMYKMSKCPDCGGDLLYADPKEYQKVDELFQCANRAMHDISKVERECLRDIMTVDEWYMIIRYRYRVSNGKLISKTPKEISRGSPVLMRPEVDEKGRPFVEFWRCPVHSDPQYVKYDVKVASSTGGLSRARNNLVTPLDESPSDKNYVPVCDICGCEMSPVRFTSTFVEGGPPEEFFLEEEVIHDHHFGNHWAYGDPPIMAVWAHVTFLIHQSIWIRDYYMRRRIPGAVLVMQSSDPAGDLLQWDKTMKKMKDSDQHWFPIFFMQNDMMGSTGDIKLVKTMEGLKEAEYTATRNESRKAIGDLLGAKIFLSGNEKNKGTSSASKEGEMEIMVDTWAFQDYINTINRIRRRLVRRLGVRNWDYVLANAEKRDESAEWDVKMKEIEYANRMQTMGFKPHMTDSGHFEYRPKPLWEDTLISVLQQVIVSSGSFDNSEEEEPGQHPTPEGQTHEGMPKMDGVDTKALELAMKYKPWGVYTNETDSLVGGFYTKKDAEKYASAMETEGVGRFTYRVEFLFKGLSTGDGNTGEGSKRTARMGKTNKKSSAVKEGSSMDNGKYKCSICGAVFDTKQQLGGHMVKAHGGPSKNSPAGQVSDPSDQGGLNGGPDETALPEWARGMTVHEAIEWLEELSS